MLAFVSQFCLFVSGGSFSFLGVLSRSEPHPLFDGPIAIGSIWVTLFGKPWFRTVQKFLSTVTLLLLSWHLTTKCGIFVANWGQFVWVACPLSMMTDPPERKKRHGMGERDGQSWRQWFTTTFCWALGDYGKMFRQTTCPSYQRSPQPHCDLAALPAVLTTTCSLSPWVWGEVS